MLNEAVVFVIPDETHEKVFMEERGPDQSQPGVRLFPGGHLELKDVKENDDKTRIAALKREIEEELEIVPIAFDPLIIDPPATSPKGTILHPYIIHTFEGELPAVIKDKGTRTLWQRLEDTLVSQSESVRVISAALVNYYANLETHFEV